MDKIESFMIRISALEKKINGLYPPLKDVCSNTLAPQLALTQCRIILEKIIIALYTYEMQKKPKQTMIGSILYDKKFAKKIPWNILAKLNYIRAFTNQGAHGQQVNQKDVIDVIYKLIDVIEWVVNNYDLLKHLNDPDRKKGNHQEIEILPQIQKKFNFRIRSDIVSVMFIQDSTDCYLETIEEIEDTISVGPGDKDHYTGEKLNVFVTNIYRNSQVLNITYECNVYPDKYEIMDNVELFLSEISATWLIDNIKPELFHEHSIEYLKLLDAEKYTERLDQFIDAEKHQISLIDDIEEKKRREENLNKFIDEKIKEIWGN